MQEAGAEYGISLQPGGTGSWQTMLPFAWQNGAELATDEEFTIDTPEMVEAIEYYDSFFTDGLAPTSVEPGALESGFVDGSIGSFVSGPWHMSILDDQAGEDFRENWAVATHARSRRPVPASSAAATSRSSRTPRTATRRGSSPTTSPSPRCSRSGTRR